MGLHQETNVYVFQPTRPRRARHDLRVAKRLPQTVSTHAPTKGATVPGSTPGLGAMSFNPRAHEGRDVDAWHIASTRRVSTHAPTKGATRLASGKETPCNSFNPRAHEGRDHTGQYPHPRESVSTHAPTKGATAVGMYKSASNSFQPTRPRRARPGRKHPI